MRSLCAYFAVLCLVASSPVIAEKPNATSARELFRKGFDQYKARQFGAAEKLFEQGLAVDEEDATAWEYYGNCLMSRSKKAKARKAYVRAASLLSEGEVKAAVDAKITALSPSILPGENCRDLVERLDPDIVQKLINKIPEHPSVRTGTFNYSSGVGTWKETTELCGSVYLLVRQFMNDKPIGRTVQILGYPHLRAADEKSHLDTTNAVPLISSTTDHYWVEESQSDVQPNGGSKSTSAISNCEATKARAPKLRTTEIVFLVTCIHKVGNQMSFTTSREVYSEFQISNHIVRNNNPRGVAITSMSIAKQ